MMILVTTLALLGATADPAVDARMVANLFESYAAEFRDVQFLYEGTLQSLAPEGKESPASTFQAQYTYRNDGATLIDAFLLSGGRPTSRYLWSLLGERKEDFDASPDILPRVSDREPVVSGGGPGVLDTPYSPERFFLANFFRSHVNAEEYGLEPQGWEEVDGRRCLVVLVYGSPRPKPNQLKRARSYYKFWLDLERNGHPLRIEWYENNQISIQSFSTLERLATPKGRLVWFPSQARTFDYGLEPSNGKLSRSTEPTFQETCRILPATIKFDQGLPDAYFSTKKQALVKSDESLAKLRRELDATKPVTKTPEPSDPESLKRRMDDALSRADAQTARLEASSAARTSGGWFSILQPWALSMIGASLVGLVLYRLGRR